MQQIRGIRGATTVAHNQSEEILAATKELLEEIVAQNQISIDQIASVLFTATSDLTAAYPAKAARQLGWQFVPLLCFQEMQVEQSLPMCIRVLLHYSTTKKAHQIQHVYQNQAKSLRPDLTK